MYNYYNYVPQRPKIKYSVYVIGYMFRLQFTITSLRLSNSHLKRSMLFDHECTQNEEGSNALVLRKLSFVYVLDICVLFIFYT